MTKWVYEKVAGIVLPLWAKHQYTVPLTEGWGQPVGLGEERVADLVFFVNTYDLGAEPEPRITHVGIVVMPGRMISARTPELGYDRYDEGYWRGYLFGLLRVL